MEQITIQVNDRDKAQVLINFLKTLDFVENVSSADLLVADNGVSDTTDFFALAGVWAEREITLQSLREKAWPYRT
jgi:hypothetical protein